MLSHLKMNNWQQQQNWVKLETAAARVKSCGTENNLPISAQLCTALHRFAQLCTDLHSFAELCRALHSFTELCTALHTFVQICTALHSYAQLYRAAPQQNWCSTHGDKARKGKTASCRRILCFGLQQHWHLNVMPGYRKVLRKTCEKFLCDSG